MSARILAGAVLGAALFGGCSWLTDFAIANLTEEPIRVAFARRQFLTTPGIKAVADLKHRDRVWTEASVDFEGRDSTRVYTFTVGPDSAFRIGSMGTYTGYYDYQADWFEVRQLTIGTENGARSYSGREVLKAFKKWSKGLYVLEYR